MGCSGSKSNVKEAKKDNEKAPIARKTTGSAMTAAPMGAGGQKSTTYTSTKGMGK